MSTIMLTYAQLLFGWSSRIMSFRVGRKKVAAMLMLQNASFYGYCYDSLDQ